MPSKRHSYREHVKIYYFMTDMSMETPEILIVEDDNVLRRGMKNMLLRNSFKIFELSFNTDIHKSIQKRTPDLIILGSSPGYVSDELNLVQKIPAPNRPGRCKEFMERVPQGQGAVRAIPSNSVRPSIKARSAPAGPDKSRR